MGWMTMAALAMAATAPAEPATQPALPEWMAGCWEQRSGDRWTEECWMPPRGGIMLGASRSGKGERLGSWEAMQIVLDPSGGMAFWAAPEGSHRTMFTRQSASEPGVTFVNSANAYPQRIRYWREGEALMAEIALADGAKPMRWRYCPLVADGKISPGCTAEVSAPK